jgi:hypothetical protein
VTDNNIGNAPVLAALLRQIPVNGRIASISGDGAYDTKNCREPIALRAADAIIPTRRNARPWKINRCGAEARNAILYATRRRGRAIWKVERLAPAPPCRNQDALFQAAGRARHGA